MKTNMGKFDRLIRILAAAVIAALFYANIISGTLAILLLIIAVVFVITSFVAVCPLYLPFGISTKSQKEKGTA